MTVQVSSQWPSSPPPPCLCYCRPSNMFQFHMFLFVGGTKVNWSSIFGLLSPGVPDVPEPHRPAQPLSPTPPLLLCRAGLPQTVPGAKATEHHPQVSRPVAVCRSGAWPPSPLTTCEVFPVSTLVCQEGQKDFFQRSPGAAESTATNSPRHTSSRRLNTAAQLSSLRNKHGSRGACPTSDLRCCSHMVPMRSKLQL